MPLEEAHTAELQGDVIAVDKCQLYKMFMDIAQSYVDFYPRISKQSHSLELGNKFRTWAQSSARAVPADSEMELDIPTYGLFRLAIPAGNPNPRMTWREFSEIIRRQTGGDSLLKIIDEVLCSVLPLGADAENDYTFFAPNHLRYGVLLAKHQRYGNNRREFVINFVPTIRRDAGGNEATSQLTAAIMMASRYWFMFLEDESSYSLDAFQGAKPLSSLAPLARKMLRDMDRVVLEATDEGLTNEDILNDLLGTSDELTDMREIWWPAMDQLRAAASSLISGGEEHRTGFISALTKFIELSRTLNRDFIRLCLDAYKVRLGQAALAEHASAIPLTIPIKEPAVVVNAGT